MARYENEPWTHLSQPLPKRKPKTIRSGETGEGVQKRCYEGFGRTIVKRHERDYNRPIGPATPPPVRYRHSDFGHEKEGTTPTKKLGSSNGIGAIPRSRLPEGIGSITVFVPELITGSKMADVRTQAALLKALDLLAGKAVRCGIDPKSDALTALDLDEKESLDAALKSGANSLLRIDINACRDGFNLAWYRQGRDGFRKERVHHVRGVHPPEIMEKIESTAGIRIPAAIGANDTSPPSCNEKNRPVPTDDIRTHLSCC